MRKILALLVVLTSILSCNKDQDRIKLEISAESCTLDNQTSYAEIRVNRNESYLSVSSSDINIAEILNDPKEENVFYIIGHEKGDAKVTVIAYDGIGEEKVQTITVSVLETIYYESFSTSGVYLKKGSSRKFHLPFNYKREYSIESDNSSIIDNDAVATISASEEMGSYFKVDAIKSGNMSFNICKGKVVIFSARVYVVDEYNLFIPESENSQLTFDLPFIAGVNGITIWRGSGHYEAWVEDKTIATVKSITPSIDYFDQENNSAIVRVTPLKSGKTKLIVKDSITGQRSEVSIIVN